MYIYIYIYEYIYICIIYIYIYMTDLLIYIYMTDLYMGVINMGQTVEAGEHFPLKVILNCLICDTYIDL